jgi:membrane dipeptidase
MNLYHNITIWIGKLIIVFLLFFFSIQGIYSQTSGDDALKAKAYQICKKSIILDAHIDWPENYDRDPIDISKPIPEGDFDYPRAVEGGLNAVLSVAFIPAELSPAEGRPVLDTLTAMISGYPKRYPELFALAKTPAELKKNFKNGLLSLVLCMENGSPVEDSLPYLKTVKDRGIVYITLCHMLTNGICDANFDSNRKWGGLSPFGTEMVKEMNRLGIMIDISHSEDSTVFDVLAVSEAPIIASHSSCRYYTPRFERNLSDTLIKAIAKHGGVVMLNVSSYQLDPECFNSWMYIYGKSDSIDLGSEAGQAFMIEYGKTHRLQTDVKRYADHIDHIVQIAGIDYVGIGTDFDGLMKETLPIGFNNVACYPNLVEELLSRGYSEKDIQKILSGNFMRVWDRVIKTGKRLNKGLSQKP